MVTLSSATVLPQEADNNRDVSHEGDFQQTDLTPLPKGWSLVRLGDVCEFQNGVNADAKAYGKGVPFANVLEVITNTFLDASRIPGRVEIPKATVTAFRVLRGDILFNRTSETLEEVGLTTLYLDDTPVVFGGFVVRGRPNPGTFDSTYLGYALRSRLVRTQISSKGQGAVRANISQAELRNVRVPRPPEPEQRAIADALSDADASVESLERLREKKRFIKQGALHDLLSGRGRLPGFSGKWSRPHLGSRGIFFKGSGIRRDQAQSGELPCVRYGELYTHHTDLIREFNSWISEEVSATARKVLRGDILFAGSGETKEEIGKCAVLSAADQAYAGGDIIVFRPRDDDPLFLGYYLNSTAVRRQKAAKGQGDAVVHISSRALADLELDVPQRDEQEAIAKVLFEMDAELEGLDAKLEKARQIKQGMMQELLTGRVRLV